MTRKTLILFASAAALAGCTNLNAPMSSTEGHFATVNFNAQVEDPTAVKGAPEMDASMSDAAIERYKAGETQKSEDDSNTFELKLSPAG